jgi:hypothetical protein
VQIVRSLRAARAPSDPPLQGGVDVLAWLVDGAGVRPDAPDVFHVFDAVMQRLVSVTALAPLVVFIDDIQWADAPSVELLEFVQRHAAHQSMLLVATYRADELADSDHPRHADVAALAQKADTIPLSGLDNEGIRELRAQRGVSTTAAEAEYLRRLTGGNPFFVIESVAFDDPRESLGVRSAIERRVSALSDAEQRALTIAALVGGDAPDAVVAAVAGPAALPALRTGDRVGLTVPAGSCHAFVHDLVRETLRDRLEPGERTAFHAAIVRAAADPSIAVQLLPAQLAWQATQAMPDITTAQVVTLLEAAAVHAIDRITYEEAGRHYADAADLADDPSETARLTLASANAYEQAGALAEARAGYTRLLAEEPIDVRALALLGLHRLGDPAAGGTTTDVARALDEIDTDALAGHTALRAQVRAARSRSRAHQLSEDRSQIAPMASEALDLARQAGDDVPRLPRRDLAARLRVRTLGARRRARSQRATPSGSGGRS